MIWHTPYLNDAAARKKRAARARAIAEGAEAGASTALLNPMIESIPEDGGDDETFSSKKEVDDAMREGEAAFTKNDMPKALEMYQRALMLDPKMYEAALYTATFISKRPIKRKHANGSGALSPSTLIAKPLTVTGATH